MTGGRVLASNGRYSRLRLALPDETNGHQEPPLTEHDARLVHESVRIDIPLVDRIRLRQVAELLRDLAGDLEAASREKLPPADHPDFHRQRRLILWELARRTDAIRRRLRALQAKGAE
jgi:hypothetical protein